MRKEDQGCLVVELLRKHRERVCLARAHCATWAFDSGDDSARTPATRLHLPSSSTRKEHQLFQHVTSRSSCAHDEAWPDPLAPASEVDRAEPPDETVTPSPTSPLHHQATDRLSPSSIAVSLTWTASWPVTAASTAPAEELDPALETWLARCQRPTPFWKTNALLF